MTTTKPREAGTDDAGSQTGVEPEQSQLKLRVDDSNADIHYSSQSAISATAEEFVVGFASGLKPGSRGNAPVLTVETKVIMSPWAAKRLAIQLTDTIKHYELTYGKLEVDARKRRLDTGTRDGE